jgi:hypothetical protein
MFDVIGIKNIISISIFELFVILFWRGVRDRRRKDV